MESPKANENRCSSMDTQLRSVAVNHCILNNLSPIKKNMASQVSFLEYPRRLSEKEGQALFVVVCIDSIPINPPISKATMAMFIQRHLFRKLCRQL